MANCELGECNGDPEYTTPIVVPGLPDSGDEGGHEFVTELPEKGSEGMEYVLMDDISDCSTYRGTYIYSKDCNGWIQISGSGGSIVVDSALSSVSTNPVQNSVITEALNATATKDYVDTQVGNIETILHTLNLGAGV